MITLAICSIVKNEEDKIRQFIDSFYDFSDEIIIVDNMSTDRTKEILESYTNVKVFRTNREFDLARNVYLENATSDWILTLDSDETILKEDYIKLKNKIACFESEVMCGLVSCNNYFGNGQWSTWFLPRVLKNNKKILINSPIHASVIESVKHANGKIEWTGVTIHHFDAIINKNQIKKRKRNIHFIKQELKKQENNKDLLVNLACELFALGSNEEALDTIRDACSILNDNATKAFRYHASIAFYCGMYEESLKAIDMQIERYKKSIQLKELRAPRSQLELDLCNVIKYKNYYALGDKDTALKLCIENIHANPELSHNYINAFILSNFKNFDYLERAIELNKRKRQMK